MQDTDVQELIMQIIEQAEEQNHTPPHLIDTWPEYCFYRDQRRSLKVVLKVLRDSAESLFKSYCKKVAHGTANVNQILAYRQFQDIIAYYDDELQIIHGMILEYTNYLASGNLFAALFGESRSKGV